MFNNTVVKSPTVNTPVNNTLNFNAVSGTLCKSHPKSFFKWFHLDSEYAKSVLKWNPEVRLNYHKHTVHPSWGGRDYQDFDEPEQKIVILQLMLTGEDRVLAEIVKESDLIEDVVIENE